jgi:hypothetical protein
VLIHSVALLGIASPAIAEEGSDVLEACASAAERGQVARHDGKLLEARAEFRTCDAAECPAVVRADCTRWIAELEGETPSVVLRARDSRGQDVIDVRVSANDLLVTNHLDGEAIALDPGRYDFRYETTSGAVATTTVLLALGEQRREITGTFAVSLMPDGSVMHPPSLPDRLVTHPSPRVADPGPAPLRPMGTPALAYVFAGVSAVSLGAFGYFEIVGQSGYSDLQDGCGRTHSCSSAQASPVKTDFVAAETFLATAVVFGGLAAWQFLSPRRSASTGWLRTPAAPARGSLLFSF